MEQIKLNFRDILIVDLYEAIEKDDPSILPQNPSKEEFDELVERYLEAQKREAITVAEKRKFALQAKIEITTGCVAYLEQEPYDKDIWAILREHGWKIEEETLGEDISRIIEGLQSLINKKKMLDEDEQSKQPSKQKKYTIYEIIATMSAGLEGIYLDPRKLSVEEFLAYQRVLENKAEQYEKIKQNNKNGSK